LKENSLRSSLFAVPFLATLIPAAAAAQESPQPSASDIALARSLASDGVQLANSGNCRAALEKLERAEALYHAPTILGRIGECQVSVGKLVLGTENLQRVTREPLPPNAPPAFAAAQTRAKKVLDSAMPRIPKLKVHVDVVGGQPNLSLAVDGQQVPTATLDADRPVDPGPHHVEVSAPGYRTAAADVTMSEGGRSDVELRLEPEPTAAAAPPPAPVMVAPPAPGPYPQPPMGAPPTAMQPPAEVAPAPMPMAPPPQQAPVPDTASKGASGGRTFGYVLVGLGGIGLAVGTATGLIAISKKTSLDARCTDGKGACPADSQSDIDSMKSMANVSTIGFAGGAVSTIIGIILVSTSHPSDRAATSEPVRSVAALRPWVGWGSAGIDGTF
jgi:hypothetical protein